MKLRKPNRWKLYTLVIVIFIVSPIFAIAINLLSGPGEIWAHLVKTVLTDYILNSVKLIVGVGFLSLLLGVSTAWVVSTNNFPGRKFFEWSLVLPLAVPGYIIAYTYSGIFDYAGPIQMISRNIFGMKTFRFDIMNIYGVIFVMAFVLYPYVYTTARAAFLNQSASILESGRLLGSSPWRNFFKLALPLSRPAIVGGLSLVIMEVLNDYGAAKYFGVSTFTTGIFRSWFSFGDIQSAIYLSAILMLIVFSMISLERIQRGKRQYNDLSQVSNPLARYNSTKVKKLLCFIICLVPLVFGFVIPVLQLGYWSYKTVVDVVDMQFLQMIVNSFSLALIASVVIVSVALLLIYSVKINNDLFSRSAAKITTLGYSIPGAVIAIGIMVPVLMIDKSLTSFLRNSLDWNVGLVLSGTVGVLIFAYLVRFLAVAYHPVESGFKKIGWQLDDAARLLGASPAKALVKINIPLIKGAILSAALLVFVDVLKELPLTLVLRPFNFDTLATKAFELASDEMIAESANAALIIILTGILPVILLSKMISKRTSDGDPAD